MSNKQLQAEQDEEELKALQEISKPIEVEARKSGIFSVFPFYYLPFLGKLFFTKRFIVHRVTGFFYLLQWFTALTWYFVDYEGFKNSFLIWSLPSTGLFQSVNAVLTFWFLPKSTRDQGYFSDIRTMSYNFVFENSFFALILLFQWLYFSDFFFNFFTTFKVGNVLELIFVFCPYMIRPFWPKTSFRDSMEFPENKTAGNRVFYSWAIFITKCFYVWAKHYIGFFLNYVRFLNRLTEPQKRDMYLLEIFSACATTISVFLHTLKFKKYMGPRTSFVIYAASYFATFYGFIASYDILIANADLFLLTFVGVVANFGTRSGQYFWQFVMMYILFSSRHHIAFDQAFKSLGIDTSLFSLQLKVGDSVDWYQLYDIFTGKTATI